MVGGNFSAAGCGRYLLSAEPPLCVWRRCVTLSSVMARNIAQSRSIALSNRAVLILISALFLAPSALFAAGLRALPSSLVLVGCIGSLALIAQRHTPQETSFLATPVNMRRFALCVMLACVIFVVGGELHLFYATYDWRIRDAVLQI